MLILLFTIFFLFHLIQFFLHPKNKKISHLKIKDLKNYFLETKFLTVKALLARQIVILIRILILGFAIRHWGFAFLEILAKFPRINPFAYFLYNHLTRSQIYDFGQFLIWYGYIVYLIWKITRWAKLILKLEKKELKTKELKNET